MHEVTHSSRIVKPVVKMNAAISDCLPKSLKQANSKLDSQCSCEAKMPHSTFLRCYIEGVWGVKVSRKAGWQKMGHD